MFTLTYHWWLCCYWHQWRWATEYCHLFEECVRRQWESREEREKQKKRAKNEEWKMCRKSTSKVMRRLQKLCEIYFSSSIKHKSIPQKMSTCAKNIQHVTSPFRGDAMHIPTLKRELQEKSALLMILTLSASAESICGSAVCSSAPTAWPSKTDLSTD